MGLLIFLDARNGLSHVPSVHCSFSNSHHFLGEEPAHTSLCSLHDTGNKEGRMMLAWGSDPRLGTFHPGLVAVLSFLDPDLRQTLLQGRGDRDGLLEMNIYAQGNVPL